MRKKFKIYYSKDDPDPDKAGKQYKPPQRHTVFMKENGVFYLCKWEIGDHRLRLLSEVIGKYDVVWRESE